jgi:O-antigen/teichoic acid export membrane protein
MRPAIITALERALALARAEAPRQTVLLYGAQIASMGLNFVFTLVIGRAMSQEDYGIFSFCVFSVVLFLGYLFEFGIFAAGARLLAVAKDREAERRMLGALVVAALAVGLLFDATIAAAAPGVDTLLIRFGYLDTHVAGILLVAAPLALAIPLQLAMEQACLGMNRIGALAAMRLALPVTSISLVAGLDAAMGEVTPVAAVVAYLGGVLASALVVMAVLKPSFRAGRTEYAALGAAVREFGLDMYLGRAIGMLSTRLDQVLIPTFVGPRRWGAYKIAQQLSDPVANLARALATTRFKAFANRTEVSREIEWWNIGLLSVASTALAAFGPWVIVVAFEGQKFRNALGLLLPFALVALFAGLLQPYNMFLSAHGEGKALRNVSLAIGAVNLAGIPAFTYRYGLAGAAWFAVASMAFNFALHLYYYQRFTRMNRISQDEQDI